MKMCEIWVENEYSGNESDFKYSINPQWQCEFAYIIK